MQSFLLTQRAATYTKSKNYRRIYRHNAQSSINYKCYREVYED